MNTYDKGNTTIVLSCISYIQEDVNGKNYVILVDGTTTEVTDAELEEIKSKLNS